jgi:hypothetical protein
LEGDGRDLLRDRKDDVKVLDRKKLSIACLVPFGPRRCLALRAVSVAAGIVGHYFVVAVIATFHMSTHGGGAAACKIVKGAPRCERNCAITRGNELLTVRADDISNLKCLTGHRGYPSSDGMSSGLLIATDRASAVILE